MSGTTKFPKTDTIHHFDARHLGYNLLLPKHNFKIIFMHTFKVIFLFLSIFANSFPFFSLLYRKSLRHEALLNCGFMVFLFVFFLLQFYQLYLSGRIETFSIFDLAKPTILLTLLFITDNIPDSQTKCSFSPPLLSPPTLSHVNPAEDSYLVFSHLQYTYIFDSHKHLKGTPVLACKSYTYTSAKKYPWDSGSKV